MTPADAPVLYLVPRLPERAAKPCHVPGCGRPAHLYAGGWLCDEHKPQPRTGNDYTERTAS